MSMGISSDSRFKIEYYGSSHHVFSELQVEGRFHVDGRRLLLTGVRSASSKLYSGGGLNNKDAAEETLPAIHGLLCSQGQTTWIALLDFSTKVHVPIFNSIDVILLRHPQKYFMAYQALSW